MDNGKVTALTLLDLSAAFETIDHSTLLDSGTVVQWFKSYISSRQRSHRRLTFMSARPSFRRPAGVCHWPFSVLCIHNVNKSNTNYS